ncbi:DUF305 domain-containing protein [Nonomuraea fuscirosea]|jgi:uncharacterized protein (DUF305 family)|uniref:DUF305 domain-containing protein n=1 Tax=Nonomuraea fuscirosea TaxID=1291556 RepID=UPI00341BE841
MALIALLALVAAGACSASADTQAGYNQADVQFNQQMITHHRQTIQLAELASERGGGDYVRKLAKEIIPKEQADIQKMSGWLTSWSEAVPAEEKTDEGAELKAGDGFDRGWLTLLKGHLEHGVHMAKEIQGTGQHTGTKQLADQIVTNQTEELTAIGKQLAI